MKSWRTTVLGLIGGLTILFAQIQAFLDNDPTTVLSYEQIMVGLGLLGLGVAARDNKVSSEKAGAK